MLISIIQIDLGETRKLDVIFGLQKLYYQSVGYQKNTKKLFEASQKAGFDFTLDEIRDWLKKQAIYQIHKSRSRYIP